VIDPCVGDWIVVSHSGSTLRTRVDGVQGHSSQHSQRRWDMHVYCRMLGEYIELWRSADGWFLQRDEDRQVHVRPLTDAERVRTAAAGVYKPEGVDVWMTARNQLLDGLTPWQMINDGEVDRVLGVIEALADGIVA